MSSQSSGIQPLGPVVSIRSASKRRQWAAVGFAAITLQVGLAIWVRAATDQPATQPDTVAGSSAATVQPSSNDLFQQGLAQYKSAQYEDAVATLGQVDSKRLSDADQITLTETLVKAQEAAHERQFARNEFDLGEQALAANHPAAAVDHYNTVIKNHFADEGTIRKANEELAVAEQDLNKPVAAAPVDPQRALYDQAEADAHAGRYSAARQEFKQLADAGYQPPIFHRTPNEMLVEIDARTGTVPAVTPAAVGIVASTDSTVPAASEPTVSSDATTTAPSTEVSAPVVTAAPATPPNDLERLQAEAENERVAAEQRRFRAAGLVDLARQADAQGDKAEALRDYSQAAALDPANQQAADGKAQLLVETGRAPAPTASSQFRNQIEVETQDIRFRFSTAVKDVQVAINNNDFATARRRLEDARVARSIDPGIFPVEEVRQMDATLAQLDQQLRDAKAAYDVKTAQATQQEVEEQQKARAEQQREQRDRTVSSLIHLARQDIDSGNYTAALGVLDQIEVLSPRNDYAEGVRQFVEDRAILQDQRRYREMFDLQYSKTLNEAEEKQVPYDDIVRYPTNWPDISEERDQEVKSERGLSREDQATQALLDKVLPEMSFENTPFNEAVDYFRDVTGANIFVNTRALEAAGVDRSATINLKLHNIRFSKALTEVLQVVGGATKLSYDIDDGVITISTSDQLNQNVVTEVYDIRDLLVDIPNYQLQDVTQVLSSLNSGGGGTMLGATGGGASTSSNSFSGANSGGNNTMQRTNKDLMDEMVTLIEQTVAPDTWRTGGGTVGAISELLASGQLVVIQTPENHRKLQDLLDKIREKRDIMVTVEARFLTVNRDFIEEVGLNLSAIFNTNQSPNSVFSTVPVTLLNDGFTQGISTGVPGTIGTNASATPASVAFTYLDDFQVNFMLEALEASNNQSLVNAPKVTVFDGGTAVIGVETLFSYVSNLQPTVGSGGSVGFTATINQVPSGVTLLVKATVSSDRKYVTLQLQPLFTSLLSLVTFQLTEPTSALSGGTGTGTTIVTGGSSSVGEFVQLPTLQVTTVETLVSVPDGGTLLMGGQTLAGETQKEEGTPVLSKIPFLKRLFTNQSMAKDEQVILLLVKPTILIQREQEDKAFPLLSNQASGE